MQILSFPITSHHKPGKYKISDNNSHLLPKGLGGRWPGSGIPPDAAVYGRFPRLPGWSL